MDVILGQQLQQGQIDVINLELKLGHDTIGFLNLLIGGTSIDRHHRNMRAQLLLKPPDPFHEKLIDIRADDSQKLQPLQQRIIDVLCLGQNPTIKLQPGKLPIQVILRILKIKLQCIYSLQLHLFRRIFWFVA